MESLVDRAGMPRITPKALRHTAQSIGRVVVGDYTVMQERSATPDIGVTLGTYTHTVTEQRRQAGRGPRPRLQQGRVRPTLLR